MSTLFLLHKNRLADLQSAAPTTLRSMAIASKRPSGICKQKILDKKRGAIALHPFIGGLGEL
ncbi:MAG TPA: hypothetical protein DCS83_06940 [Prevotella sp.]|nr:hypothetical protein [Prevotella sp.]